MKESIDLVECPRDAMQGIHQFIPTEKKVSYLNALLKVGFHTLDCGSFVSPEAIPQLRDTDLVLDRLDLSDTRSKLLTIVANQRGGERAAQFEQISCLGYPFSVSEIFQKRNTNKSIAESLKVVDQLLNIAERSGKELVVYISMGFGNPYREPWSVNLVEKYVGKLIDKGVKTLSLSDTIGTSNPDSITYLFENLIQAFPQATIGAHLHTTSDTWYEKVSSAYDAGCRRFDGAIKGFGGCPMATDELTGNMPTEKLISFVEQRKIPHQLNMLAFESAYNKAMQTFPA